MASWTGFKSRSWSSRKPPKQIRERNWKDDNSINAERPSVELGQDAESLAWDGELIQHHTKELKKLKTDIVRKRKREKSKHLADCEGKYESTKKELTVVTKRLLTSISPGEEFEYDKTGGFNKCRECERKQLKIFELKNQLDKMSHADPEKYVIDLSRAENKVMELQREVDRLKQQARGESTSKDNGKGRVNELQREVDRLKQQLSEGSASKGNGIGRVSELQRQVDRLNRQLGEESALKDDAIRRLSELASSKLRDNNPNIADLSDKNRPTKIAEKVSEMYDNEWTDAFDEMETDTQYSEKELIEYLLKALMDIFAECQRITTQGFFERVQACIEHTDMLQVAHNQEEIAIPDQLRQQIKEFRKLRAVQTIETIIDVLLKQKRFAYLQRAPYNSEKAREYVKKCVEISWLMCVQDPPLLLSTSSPKEFNSALYREYTKRGRYTAFVVWPIVYLHEEGPILCKGVAQGTTEYNANAGRPLPLPNITTDKQRDMLDSRSPQHTSSSREYPRSQLQMSMFPNINHGFNNGQRQPIQYSQRGVQTQHQLGNTSPYDRNEHGPRSRDGQRNNVSMVQTYHSRGNYGQPQQQHWKRDEYSQYPQASMERYHYTNASTVYTRPTRTSSLQETIL